MLVLGKRTEVFLFESPQFSKSSFSVSRGFISSIEVSIEKLKFQANIQVEKLSIFSLATET